MEQVRLSPKQEDTKNIDFAGPWLQQQLRPVHYFRDVRYYDAHLVHGDGSDWLNEHCPFVESYCIDETRGTNWER